MSVARQNLLLVLGGQSTEHEISCLTAAGVVKAIDPGRFLVHGVAIAKDGTWKRISPEAIADLRTVGQRLPEVDEDLPGALLLRDAAGVTLATLVDGQMRDPQPVDVAFAVLHGAYGEDGTIQGYFEMLGLPYVGSGVGASAIGMDKDLMKTALCAAGIPMGPYTTITRAQWLADRPACLRRVTDRLAFPVFVKPARGGSSVGIVRVAEPTGLAAAIESTQRFDPKVVVEEGIVNAREVECAVLGGRGPLDAPRASAPGEIVVHTPEAFYDFEAKYLPEGQVELLTPTHLDDEHLRQVQDLAIRSFAALGCEGLARVDTFITADGRVLVNEVNTMPGFTELSMFPSLWQVSGLDYRSLITDLVDQACARPTGVIR